MSETRCGLLQLYTGHGKGKTTAALGLALRASGQGLRVCMLQFLKGNDLCGEHAFVEKWPAFRIWQPSQQNVFTLSAAERRELALVTLQQARQLMAGGEYDLLILDEVLTTYHLGHLALAELLELARGRPAALELVMTGRGAPAELIELADLVTEMRLIKHPYKQGVPARRGIEF